MGRAGVMEAALLVRFELALALLRVIRQGNSMMGVLYDVTR